MILDILEYPDSRLRKIAAPVAVVTADIRKLVRDMAETMYAAPGIGLAATQVNVHKRIIVIDASPTHDDLKVFINPELLKAVDDAIKKLKRKLKVVELETVHDIAEARHSRK